MTLRRSVAAVALLLAAPVLSSCGVGFDEQTDLPYNPSAGVDNRSGTVNVLNALVVSGTNGSGTVIATLVNEDQTHADKLRSVTGAGADSTLKVTTSGPTDVPAGGILNLATDGGIAARGTRVVPGNLVEITFSFNRAESITVKAPVVSHDNPVYADVKVPS